MRLETRNCFLVLRLVIARLAASAAVVAAVLAETHIVLAETDGAVAVAGALLLIFLADHALIAGALHEANLAPGAAAGKVTEVRGKNKPFTTEDTKDTKEIK